MTEPGPTAAAETGAAALARLERQVGTIVRGKPEVIRLAVVCLLARGHMLIEDVPGVGKTTLAQALARSLGLEFQRIQFTSDLLPSDIIGVSVYKRSPEQFEFVRGPIFANVVLADEINRASPKTQSALLEAMSERRVTVDKVSHALPDSFIVIATQNPMEYVGTFPLPESQLDRFMMSLQLGYPPRSDERELLMAGGVRSQLGTLEPVLGERELAGFQEEVRRVRVEEKLVNYMLALAGETRRSPDFLLGVSTRGVQSLYAAVQAMAVCEGRSFAIPDDVQRLAPAVLAHRVILRGGEAGLDATREAVRRVVAGVAVPI
ncbi:MAG: AAA family ATPase [Thermoanaerobaculia bacterium]|nr:AAA family ATPase [Thermoanaerobaculia bacterium]